MRSDLENYAKIVEPVAKDKSAQLNLSEALYFYQARDDAKAGTGDKGIIERFSERPLKVRLASEEIKRKIVGLEENIFRLVFIVDVRVHKVGGRVAAYTIYNIRDWFEKP